MSQLSPEPLPAPPPPEDRAKWFAQEVHPHSAPLKAWLNSSFPELRHDADDVVQDSLFKAWQEGASKGIRSAKAYLYGIARHGALNFLRRRRRSPIDSLSSLEHLGAYEDRQASVEVALTIQQKVELLTDLVAALPPRRREVIILCKFELLTAEAAATQLGRSLRSVQSDLFRGINDVRAQLRSRGIKSLHDEVR